MANGINTDLCMCAIRRYTHTYICMCVIVCRHLFNTFYCYYPLLLYCTVRYCCFATYVCCFSWCESTFPFIISHSGCTDIVVVLNIRSSIADVAASPRDVDIYFNRPSWLWFKYVLLFCLSLPTWISNLFLCYLSSFASFYCSIFVLIRFVCVC